MFRYLIFCFAIVLNSCGGFVNESTDNVNNLGTINSVLNMIQDDLYDNMDNSRQIGTKLRNGSFKRASFRPLKINTNSVELFDQAIAAKRNLPKNIQIELGYNIEDLKKNFLIAQNRAKKLNNEITSGNYKENSSKFIGLNHEVLSYYHGLSELMSTIGEVTDKYYKVFELDAIPVGQVGEALRRMILDKHQAEKLLTKLTTYYEGNNLEEAKVLLTELESSMKKHQNKKLNHHVLSVSYDLFYSYAVNNFINDSKKFIKEASAPNISQKKYDSLYKNILSSYNSIIDGWNSFNDIQTSLPY